MTRLEIALQLLKLDWPVIPITTNLDDEGQPHKAPYVSWAEYQKRFPTEKEVTAWWTEHPDANIAVTTGMLSGIAVIDLDSEDAEAWFGQFLDDGVKIPIVTTPRGGKHLYFKCPDAKLRGHSGTQNVYPKCDLRANGNLITIPPSAFPKFEPYRWVNGFSMETLRASLPPFPNKYLQVLLNNNLYSLNARVAQDVPAETGDYKRLQMFTKGNRNESLFHVANCLSKGYARREEASQVIEILAKNCTPPYPKGELQAIVNSAMERFEQRSRNIADEVRSFVMTTKGIFSTTDIHRELQMTTRSEKKNVSVIIQRLLKDKTIERSGNKNGHFRLIDTTEEVIDIEGASEEPFPMVFPLELQDYVTIFPKNVIIVAGQSNAGKSAFLMNLAIMNYRTHKVKYMSSEMDGTELKMRLQAFDIPLKELQENIRWIEKSTDWWDAIDPEGINIIDYMEITEEHYRIGGWITQVRNKLTTGVVVIAIQKPAGRSEGTGGRVTRDKARLYVALDFNRAEVVKGKNWQGTKHNINPDGMFTEFSIYRGRIEKTGIWQKPQEKI